MLFVGDSPGCVVVFHAKKWVKNANKLRYGELTSSPENTKVCRHSLGCILNAVLSRLANDAAVGVD